MTDYRDGRWHGWNGGECPVNPEDVVDLAWDTAGPDCGVPAQEYSWRHEPAAPKIVAFRVVKKAPRVWWVNEYPDGDIAGFFDTRDEAARYATVGIPRTVKVQEVEE